MSLFPLSPKLPCGHKTLWQGKFKEKEAKRLDLLGRKIYSTLSHLRHVANQKVLLSKYYFNWKTSKFTEKLLEDAWREEFKVFLEEGCLLAKTMLQLVLDVLDASYRVMAFAITIRRVSWLQNSGIAPNFQHTAEDLAFDEQSLFCEKTDEIFALI